MGYRGKLAEKERARELRAEGWVMNDIARELGVSKSSVSLWVRDVEFTPLPRRPARRGPNKLQLRKQAEIEEMNREGTVAPALLGVDETRLRVRLYLHEGLDLAAANTHWSDVTGIPTSQFGKPYRATPDEGIRHSKHIYGCPRVEYSCSRTHRAIMGLVRALLSSASYSGVVKSASQLTVNQLFRVRVPAPELVGSIQSTSPSVTSH